MYSGSKSLHAPVKMAGFDEAINGDRSNLFKNIHHLSSVLCNSAKNPTSVLGGEIKR